MAYYAVTSSETDNWGDDTPGARRFNHKSEADVFLTHEQDMGRFARLVVWDKGAWKELARINEPPGNVAEPQGEAR